MGNRDRHAPCGTGEVLRPEIPSTDRKERWRLFPTRQHTQPPYAFGSGGWWLPTFGSEMKTASIIIAGVLSMAFSAWAGTNDAVFLGRIDPDATLRHLQSMPAVTNDDRIAVVTWFPSEFWQTRCLIYSNGTVQRDTSSPLRGHRPAKHTIPAADLRRATSIVQTFPPSSVPENHRNMLILSIRAGNTWTHHVYDRARPPDAASAFCTVLGIGEKMKMNPEPPAGGDGKPAPQP